jgi:hypothetical protein
MLNFRACSSFPIFINDLYRFAAIVLISGMHRVLFFIVIFFFSGIVSAQTFVDTLTPQQYKRDFAVLQQVLKTSYPSLYRFKDKRTMDRLFDSCYHTIDKRTNATGFYAMTKFLFSAIGDGHLSCSPSTALRKSFEAQYCFPLSMVFLGDKVYNYCDYGSVPIGAEIVAINNISIGTIRKKLSHFVIGDGNITSYKNWVLGNVFWVYYYMVYGKQESFVVRYKLPGAVCKNISLPAKARNEHVCTSYTAPEPGRLLNLEYPNKKVAVLTIATFNDELLRKSKLDFRSFLDSSFRNIKQKGISKLIIDLRSNGGGADAYGASLYSCLTRKPFQYYKQLITLQRKLTVADHPVLGLQQPGNIGFDGEVFVLVNGLSFSATTEFCAVAKSNKRALFIGEETGGTYVGNTSGVFVERLLPNTQIKISVPTTQYVMAVKKEKLKNRGIIPDHIVMPTMNDILGKKDVQLEYAVKLAGGK